MKQKLCFHALIKSTHIFAICTIYVCYCTISACHLHNICVQPGNICVTPAQYTCDTCTIYLFHLYNICVQPVQYMFATCTIYVCQLYNICIWKKKIDLIPGTGLRFIKPARSAGARRTAARSAGFSRIQKIPYQAPPTQLGPQKCTFWKNAFLGPKNQC